MQFHTYKWYENEAGLDVNGVILYILSAKLHIKWFSKMLLSGEEGFVPYLWSDIE